MPNIESLLDIERVELVAGSTGSSVVGEAALDDGLGGASAVLLAIAAAAWAVWIGAGEDGWSCGRVSGRDCDCPIVQLKRGGWRKEVKRGRGVTVNARS